MYICLFLMLVYILYEYRASLNRLRIIGDTQVKLQYRFESDSIFLFIAVLVYLYHTLKQVSHGFNVLEILMYGLLFIVLAISIYRVYGRELICEHGIVTHQGVFFWRDIIYYYWSDALLTGNRIGITFQVKKGKKFFDISLPLKKDDIEVVSRLISNHEVNAMGPH